MAPTSDERREVAARLRERAQLSNFCPFESFFVRLNVIIFGDNGWDRTDGGVLERLADLIDPTCHVIDMGWPNDYAVVRKCDACGRSWTQDPLFEPYRFCPHCGARVVNGDD